MNIANKLTLARIIMIPVFLIVLLAPIPGALGRYIAAVIFVLACLTDFVDGYLARSRNLITTFGKFIDPLADKLLISAALIALVELGDIYSWVVIIIISREFIVQGVRLVAAEKQIVIAAGKTAKYKTATQMVMTVFYLLGLHTVNNVLAGVGAVLVVISVVLSIVSAYEYISANIFLFKGGI